MSERDYPAVGHRRKVERVVLAMLEDAADQFRAIARLRSTRLKFIGYQPRAALADSLALGYYLSPFTGLSVCGVADK